MIIFVISLILGVAKIIPQTDFEGWRIAMTLEIVAEFAGVVIWVLFKAYLQPLIKRKNTPKPIVKRIYVKDVTEMEKPEIRHFQPVYSGKPILDDEAEENPYEEGRLYYYAWNEKHGKGGDDEGTL